MGRHCFQVDAGGSATVLYNFCSQSDCTDGSLPPGLLQCTDGNFYGTTLIGGAGDSGTLFKITSSGTLTMLHSFDGSRWRDCPRITH